MVNTITALQAQKRDPSRVNVYLDGEFAFGLDRLVAAWLAVGQQIDEEKKEKLLQADALEKAYQKALKFIDYRIRSESEIRKKLQENGYEGGVIDQIIARLVEARLAGDSSFAKNWVDNRSTFRPRSHRMLRMELRQKGVDESLIDEALEKAPNESDLARRLGEKYAFRLRDVEKQVFCKKLAEYLLRKGFDYSIAKDTASHLWSERMAGSDTTLIIEDMENGKCE
jgi:regulatory protein